MLNSADIASVVEDPDEFLRLPVEKKAALMLRLIGNAHSYPERPIAHSNFFNRANDYAAPPKYGARQKEVDHALLRVWKWAENHGLLAMAPSAQGSWFYVTKEGQSFAENSAISAFPNSHLLVTEMLHPRLAGKVADAFLAADFDGAALQAMKAVEVSVRGAAGLGNEHYGTALMRKAFSVDDGPLTDLNAERAERVGRMELFAGAIACYKNPHSHREVNLQDPFEAVEIIYLANHLLRIVDARAEARKEGPPA